MTPWLAALLCLTLAPGTRATDETDEPKASTTQENSSESPAGEREMREGEMPAHPAEASAEATPSEGAPTRYNKASGILGMDVRNQNDEHLGHVKDLVIDWKTGQVSYAVISTASKLLGMGGKLLAVPLNALATSSDQKHLVLNADKSKLEAAQGFTSDNWPSVSSPSWGAEPFWQSGADKPSLPDQPPKASETNTKSDITPDMPPLPPGTGPEAKPEVGPESKSNDDPEAPPDMENDSQSDQDPESNAAIAPDPK